MTPPTPTYVITLFFYCIPGRIPRLIKIPPKRPPKWAIASIELSIEKSNEKNTIKPIMQAMVDRNGPNLYKAVQLMIRYAMNPPKIPNIEVEDPTVIVFISQTTLSSKP